MRKRARSRPPTLAIHSHSPTRATRRPSKPSPVRGHRNERPRPPRPPASPRYDSHMRSLCRQWSRRPAPCGASEEFIRPGIGFTGRAGCLACPVAVMEQGPASGSGAGQASALADVEAGAYAAEARRWRCRTQQERGSGLPRQKPGQCGKDQAIPRRPRGGVALSRCRWWPRPRTGSDPAQPWAGVPVRRAR